MYLHLGARNRATSTLGGGPLPSIGGGRWPSQAVGAVVVGPDGVVVGRGHNAREATGDPTAHAELVALRDAAAGLGRWRLDDCTLVVTLEPASCAPGRSSWRGSAARPRRMDPKAGACGSQWDVVRDRRANHRVEVVGGVREQESAASCARSSPTTARVPSGRSGHTPRHRDFPPPPGTENPALVDLRPVNFRQNPTRLQRAGRPPRLGRAGGRRDPGQPDPRFRPGPRPGRRPGYRRRPDQPAACPHPGHPAGAPIRRSMPARPRPLRFRPTTVVGAEAEVSRLTLRLEGLTLVRRPQLPDQPAPDRARRGQPPRTGRLHPRPGGYRRRGGTRAGIGAPPVGAGHGFAQAADRGVQGNAGRGRSGASPARFFWTAYTLDVRDSIIDAGRGVADPPGAVFAVSNATDPVNGCGPPTHVSGATFFGRVRVEEIEGRGGIWVHALEVHNNQKGCIKYSYFCGSVTACRRTTPASADRTPGCVSPTTGTGTPPTASSPRPPTFASANEAPTTTQWAPSASS